MSSGLKKLRRPLFLAAITGGIGALVSFGLGAGGGG
jgi:hypothetical protein